MTATAPGDGPAAEEAGSTHIALQGELDVTAIEAVRALLTFEETPKDLLIDMTAVTYIDSAVLNMLFRVAKQCPTTLVGPPRPVRRIAAISGLDQLVRITDPP